MNILWCLCGISAILALSTNVVIYLQTSIVKDKTAVLCSSAVNHVMHVA